MKKRSDSSNNWEALREKIIGLGESSIHKSYYPELQQRLDQLDRFKTLLDKSSDCILFARVPSGQLADVNETSSRMLGCSREDLLGKSVLDLVQADAAAQISSFLNEARAVGGEGEIVTTTLKCGAGAEIPVEMTMRLVSLGDSIYAVIVARDITERRLAEETLRLEHAFRTAVIERAAEGILVCLETKEYPYVHFTIWNDRMAQITGYTMEEINRLGWYQTLHPNAEAREKAKGRMLRLRQGDDLHGEEWEIVRRDGARRVLNISTSILAGNQGEVHILAMMHDITERKQAERALRESDERFRQMTEISPLPIAIIEPDGRYVYLNRKFTEVFGYTLETIPHGRQWFKQAFPDPELRRKAIATWLEDLSNHPEYETKPREFVVRCANGKSRDILFRPITMQDGKQFVIYEDFTQRRQAERELLRLEKLESVGLLAGGIAHDFNNLLTGILGNISLARMDASPGDRVYERLLEAEKATARAKDLTQQLLTFSRGGAPIKKRTSLQGIIRDSSEFILSGSKSRCEYDVPLDLWLAEVDEGQVSQVLSNIVINADHAMPQGGVIRIRAANCRVEADFGLPLEPGNYVRISIRDEGIGIGRDELPKIFDPYFTTKHKGSGLGLATAHSIVLKHGGHITVESEPASGTTFHIHLPATQDQSPVAEQRTESQLPLVNAKILVMDDEEIIREVAGQMLKRLGCQVEFAEDGAEALVAYARAREAGEPFDAVLMDLTIPGGMGGTETIGRLRAIDPLVKAIVSSGYSSDPIMADFAAYGFAGVVSKPYQLRELADAIIAAIRPS